jgi:hypothetical protein
MNFYSLNSIVAAHKKTIPMRQSTESFLVAPQRSEPYIEPTFEKVEFAQERPAVILISAVGATGKTTLAHVLSSRTALPLLDLAKHKPVGDNTLTGLLTTAFRVEDLTSVFDGIGQGTFGVIIDGVDEARSKTTEKAFEAFLDDLARLCRTASATSFVLLGRTQTLEDSWIYLSDKGVPTGLVTISPFDLDKAREYIDAFTAGLKSSHPAEYTKVRDMILRMLAAAFRESTSEGDHNFLSFIGYPPVLDAIVTLLQEERNYHRLSVELSSSNVPDVEIQLLYRIASYILRREKDQKVVPNIVMPLVASMPKEKRDEIQSQVFKEQEQCMRLVAHCLGRQLTLGCIGEPLIDEKYEAQLASFLPEHPFIQHRQFRNAIFEALALGRLILSGDPDAVQLALDYSDGHKYNYHLVYLLHTIAGDQKVPIRVLPVILGSAMEFRSRTASVEIDVHGPDVGGVGAFGGAAQTIEIEIEILTGANRDESKSFTFRSDLEQGAPINLGRRLASTTVSLPGEVALSSDQELELTAPVEIFAEKIILRSPALIVKPPAVGVLERQVVLEAETLESTVGSILTNSVELVLAVADRTGVTFPAIQYAQQKRAFLSAPLLREKYLRLRRIFVHFRSHGKGTLAKYRHKIEHERVLGGRLGQAILQRCLKDGILVLQGSFYFLCPEKVDEHLGVSWLDLRKGRTSLKLEEYLRSVN